MKTLLKFLTASAFLAMPAIGHSTDIPSSSSVAVYVQNSSGTTICSFLAAAASYQVTNTVSTTSTSSGAGAGKAAVGPLILEKSVDNCSSILLYSSFSYTQIAHVFVVVAPPKGSTGQSSFVIEASSAYVTSFSDATSKTLKLEETVSLAYESLSVAEVTGTSTIGACSVIDASRNIATTSGCSSISSFLNTNPALPTTY